MTKTVTLWTTKFRLLISLTWLTQVLSTEITPKCIFSHRNVEHLGKSLYECKLEKENMRVQNVSVDTVSGPHIRGKNNRDVKFLIFDDFRCDTIPPDFGKIFPNLLGIRAISDGLKTIEAENLQHFKHLKYIRVQDNRIRFLKDNVFKFNSDLEYVEFIQTDLVYIGNRCFDHLMNLKLVNFRDSYQLNPSIRKIHKSPWDLSELKRTLHETFRESFESFSLNAAKADANCQPLLNENEKIEEYKRKFDSQTNELKELLRAIKQIEFEKEQSTTDMPESTTNCLQNDIIEALESRSFESQLSKSEASTHYFFVVIGFLSFFIADLGLAVIFLLSILN
jgi:hypothetical protein